jgi:hypothetical protein
VTLDDFEKLLSEERLTDFVDMDSLREHWSETVEGSKDAWPTT